MYKYTEALPGGFRNCGVALVIHAHANAPSALVLVTTVVGRLSKWRTERLYSVTQDLTRENVLAGI
jgi:hypothetical protein